MKLFCRTELTLADHGAYGNTTPSIIPDSRTFHDEDRLTPALRAATKADATRYRTQAVALLGDLIRIARDGHAQLVALGLPTVPDIRNGTRMQRYYDDSLTAFAARLARLQPIARNLPVDDLARFRKDFAAFRVDALAAGEVTDAYWGKAQRLDTTHALETQFGADRDCYWIGD